MTNNELIRQLRKKLGLSQKDMAEVLHMDARTLSRIENGLRDLHLWEFISLMEMAGARTEDWWVLYLESKEYGDYTTYRETKRLFRVGKYKEAREMLVQFEKGLLRKHSFIVQFTTFVKYFTDKEISNQETLEGLQEAIKMSRKDFDESKVEEYHLTYNEIYILIGIADRLDSLGETGRAIKLYEAMVEGRENAITSSEDRATLFPPLLFNLSNLLRKSGDTKEALRYSNIARDICIEYNNLRLIPRILFSMAKCYYEAEEDEGIYKTYLIRAYHSAYAIGNNELGSSIKKYAESIGIRDCFS